MPTLTQLEYLLAVHKTGHFGRAAQLVGVSQPALSTQIQKAEARLGVTVFNRRSKPIVATELGLAVIEHAKAVVAAHEQLMRMAAGRFRRPTGKFSLGIIPTLAPYTLPWFLSHFARKYPAVELTIYERPTDDIVAQIGLGRLDAAILATPLGERSILERVLFYDPFYLYAHRDEPVLQAREVEVRDLAPGKLWLLEDGHCVRAQVVNFCGAGERLHLGSVRFAAGSLATVRHLIDASEGYTLIPETYARTLPQAVRVRNVRPFAEDRTPTRQVSLVHHQQSWKRDILDALERIVRASIPRALAQVGGDDAEDPDGSNKVEILSIRPGQSGR